MILERMKEVHRVSRHPQQAALCRDILEYYRYPISPSGAHVLCLGFGFEYLRNAVNQISRDFLLPYSFVNGYFSKDRKRLSQHLRTWLDVYRGVDFDKGFGMLSRYHQMGRPVIVEVETIGYLDFMKSWYDRIGSTSFINGYMINTVGFDSEKKVLFFQDSRIEDMLEMPLDVFRELWHGKTDYVDVEGEWVLVVVPRHRLLLEPVHVFADALRLSIHEMLSPYRMDPGYELGISGLRSFVAQYREAGFFTSNWRDSVREMHFHSEILHSQSGLFRRDFAEFLREYSVMTKRALCETAAEYDELASDWGVFLGHLHNYAKAGEHTTTPIEPPEVELLQEICRKEIGAVSRLSEMVGPRS
jgi:hypothetical protein